MTHHRWRCGPPPQMGKHHACLCRGGFIGFSPKTSPRLSFYKDNSSPLILWCQEEELGTFGELNSCPSAEASL